MGCRAIESGQSLHHHGEIAGPEIWVVVMENQIKGDLRIPGDEVVQKAEMKRLVTGGGGRFGGKFQNQRFKLPGREVTKGPSQPGRGSEAVLGIDQLEKPGNVSGRSEGCVSRVFSTTGGLAG